MGRLERRLRQLEERDAQEGVEAAARAATTEDIYLMGAYCDRLVAAEEAGAAPPNPTPEEEEAWERFEDLRRRAVREGWATTKRRPG